MTTKSMLSWPEGNQRWLMAALNKVRSLLERHADQSQRSDSPPEITAAKPEVHEKPPDLSPPPALETLCEIFSLSSFERQVLLMCAGIELERLLCFPVRRRAR